MKTKKALLGVLMAGVALMSINTEASVVTSNTGFTVVEDFEGFDGLVTQGPTGINGGGVVTSDVYSTLGAFAVNLENNGTWGAGNKFAGIGDLSLVPTTNDGYVGNMTFTLGAPVLGVGALFSIYNDGIVSGEVTIEALDAGNSVLESTTFVVDFNNAGLSNEGLFYGFDRANADIVGLRVTGDGFVLDNLSVKAVPVPPAFLLMLSGLFGVFSRRRKK